MPPELAQAEAAHVPLAFVSVRLDHFRDLRDFSGQQGSEAVVQTVARRLKRTLGPDDLAFRLGPDTLVFTLHEHDARAARAWALDAAHEVAGQLIDRQRQTLSFGFAAYPPLRDARSLVEESLASLAAQTAAEPAALVVVSAEPVALGEMPVAVAL
jgi:diguanylate cyclase (GGDEF)-like protein